MTPDERAAAVLARQHGAISFDQALAAGLSPDQVQHRHRAGRWRRPVRGVYVLAGAPDTAQQRGMVAWLATSRADGVLSHLTAAAWWGLAGHPLLPHVTVPPASSHDCRAAKVHRSAVPIVDRAHRDGVVLTSASRTLADCAALVDRPLLEELVDAAFCRRLATCESTMAAAARAGRRRGVQLLRSVVEVWSAGIEPGSVAEMRLLRLLAELGVDVVTQYDVCDGDFRARLDVAAPDIRCALEYDGVEVHSPRAWDRDERRYARLRALGWNVDSVSKLDLLPGERRLRDIVDRWHRRPAA